MDLRIALLVAAATAPACVATAVIHAEPGSDPTPDPDPDPDPDPRHGDAVSQLAVVGDSACATLESGRVHCWGDGPLTQAGLTDPEPLDLTDIDDAVSTDGFIEYGCVLHDTGRVSCWGYNHHLMLGGAIPPRQTAYEPVLLPHVSGAVLLTAGHHHVCMVDEWGQVGCWGEPYSRSLGTVRASEVPILQDLDAHIVDASAGIEHVCALGDSSQVWCWGQFGYDVPNGPVGALEQVLLPIRALHISAGWDATCAWDHPGEAWCWGALGDSEGRPQRLDAPPLRELSVGYTQVCGITEPDEQVWCSERADGDLHAVGPATHIAMSAQRACAATGAGEVACWNTRSADLELTWEALPE